MKKEHKKELEELMREMTEEAKKVRKDFKEKPSTEGSGSQIHIHENSPLLVERDDRLITFGDKKIKIKTDSK